MARLHRDVMRILVADIVTGRRAPGDKLPRELDLSEQFGVSRGVARETIRAMEERGLIAVKHGKGATVNGAERWSIFDPDVLAAMLEGEGGTDVLAQYLDCRRILEVEAAGLAAQRARKQDAREIAGALARMEQSAEQAPSPAAEELFHEADVAFHQAVIAATGNRALGGLVDRLHAALLVARHALAQPRFRVERALPEHRRILEAVSAGDPEEARSAMRDHLDTVARYLREQEAAKRRTRAGAAG
jgi:GntR family transcriptional repressor for pyruvate dehydrogenase complex